MTKNNFVPLRQNLAFFWFLLKFVKFNGVDTTGFLKSIVVLMHLFIFVQFLKPCCYELKNNKVSIEKLIGKRIVFFLENFILMAFRSTVFSFNFFNLTFLLVFFILYVAVKC